MKAYTKYVCINSTAQVGKKKEIQFSCILDESVNLTLVEDVHLREAELH